MAVDLDGDGLLEVVVSSHFGPGYVLTHDGDSYFGTDELFFRTLARERGQFGIDSTAQDGPTYAALGSITVGKINPEMNYLAATGCASLSRMLDNALATRRIQAEDQLGLWTLADGAFHRSAPLPANDLQFFCSPLFADLNGDGRNELVYHSSHNDLRIVDMGKTSARPCGISKNTWGGNSSDVGRNGHVSMLPLQLLHCQSGPGIGEANGDGHHQEALVNLR